MLASKEASVREAERNVGPFAWDENDGLSKEMCKPRRLETGGIYMGQFDVQGLKSGRGIYVWDDGSKYIGYYDKGKATGKGRLIHVDGDIYEGQWKDDKANGKGRYIHLNGAIYDGDWLNDK